MSCQPKMTAVTQLHRIFGDQRALTLGEFSAAVESLGTGSIPLLSRADSYPLEVDPQHLAFALSATTRKGTSVALDTIHVRHDTEGKNYSLYSTNRSVAHNVVSGSPTHLTVSTAITSAYFALKVAKRLQQRVSLKISDVEPQSLLIGRCLTLYSDQSTTEPSIDLPSLFERLPDSVVHYAFSVKALCAFLSSAGKYHRQESENIIELDLREDSISLPHTNAQITSEPISTRGTPPYPLILINRKMLADSLRSLPSTSIVTVSARADELTGEPAALIFTSSSDNVQYRIILAPCRELS